MAQLPLNSISVFTDQSPGDIIKALLASNRPINEVIAAVFACLSQKPVPELLQIVESSNLFSMLRKILDRIESQVIADMNVVEMLREMFSNFSDPREGIENLIAVSALLVLVRIPTNDVSVADDEKIEELKALVKSSLFCDDIVIHFIGFHDEQQRRLNGCPCVNCNARFILSIGWYIAAQDAHDQNAFVANANFLLIA
jgi:hypothetical protein